VGMSVAEGVNDLIKRGWAKMTMSVYDILAELGLEKKQMKLELGEQSNPILVALESGPKTADELARILKVSVGELMGQLSLLCLAGQVEERDGLYWAYAGQSEKCS